MSKQKNARKLSNACVTRRINFNKFSYHFAQPEAKVEWNVHLTHGTTWFVSLCYKMSVWIHLTRDPAADLVMSGEAFLRIHAVLWKDGGHCI